MNEKNDLYNKRKIYSFNKTHSFKKYFNLENINNKGTDFRRATSTCILNTDGEKPLILYFKSPTKNNHHIFNNKQFESKYGITNYVSDGGLKQKNKKYLNLLSKYPINYKFHSPLRHKKQKQISTDLKKRRYNSLSFSKRRLAKNRTTNDYNNCYEESNLFFKSSKKKLSQNFIENIKHKNKPKIEINRYIDNYKYNKSKNYYTTNLIKNIIKNKNLRIKVIKDEKPTIKFIRKKEILERNGIDISNIEATNGAKTENLYKEKYNNKDKKKEFKNILKIKNIFELKNKYSNKKETNKNKKPTIDQFEYIKKILKAYKKYIESKSEINNDIKNDKIILDVDYKKTNSKNQKTIQLNKGNILSKKYYMNKNEKEKPKNETSNDETCDEFPYSHKKSHRNMEELRVFNRLKKMKQKKKSKEKELEKKRKLYIRFTNLYKLNVDNINTERISNKIKTLKIKDKSFKNKKVKNNYYFGDENSKNNSTLIEQNDYYLSLFQSKQVIANSNINISNKLFEYIPSIYNFKNIINNKNNNIIYNEKIIFKFIKIIKSIINKKVFNNLYQNYKDIKFYYNYFLAINYLIAIIKQYPFSQIYLYCINKAMKYYYSEDKKLELKISYFIDVLSVILKKKNFEKIINYSKQVEIEIIKTKLETVFKLIVKSYLKVYFKNIKDKILKDKNNYNKKIRNNNFENKILTNKEEKNYNIDFNKEIKNIKEKNIIKEIDIKKRIEDNNSDKIIKIEEPNYISYKKEDKNLRNDDINNNEDNLNINNFKNLDNEDYGNDFSDKKDNDHNIHLELNWKNKSHILKQNSSSDFNENSLILNEDKDSNTINKINNNNIKEKNENINNIKTINNNNNENKSNPDNKTESKNINNPNKFADDLTKEIIKNICNTEITSQNIRLIPSKSFNNEIIIDISNQKSFSFLNNSNTNEIISKDLNKVGIKNTDLSLISEESKLSLNTSLIFSSSTYSIFNKDIKEKKKENEINFYLDKVVPKLIKIIQKELIDKHKRIYNNISTPYINNSKNILISISLNDKKMFEENYKIKMFKENIEDIIDKKNILKKFDKINNEIRIKKNSTSDNYYDKMINECIIDTVIELINKERINYIKGEPLLWNTCEKEEINKYDIRSNPKKFSLYICKSLISLLNKKLGIISDKYNLLNLDKKNIINEKRLNDIMKEEVIEIDKEWDNLEIEETKIKLEATDYIFEMILRENIEILEHIQYSRQNPDLYNYKSIYCCTNMPKLDFQKTENNNTYFDDEDDLINY